MKAFTACEQAVLQPSEPGVAASAATSDQLATMPALMLKDSQPGTTSQQVLSASVVLLLHLRAANPTIYSF